MHHTFSHTLTEHPYRNVGWNPEKLISRLLHVQEHCEEYGRMLQADPVAVSSRAKKRGLPQVSEASRFLSGGGVWMGRGSLCSPPPSISLQS